MNTLGQLSYIIAFGYKNYIVFVNLKDANNEPFEIGDKVVEKVLSIIAPKQYKTRSAMAYLQSEEYVEFIYELYNNNPPERELLLNRGISLSITTVNGKPKLLLQYVVNGDTTAIPQIVGYAYQGQDEVTGDLVSKVLTFHEFLDGVTNSSVSLCSTGTSSVCLRPSHVVRQCSQAHPSTSSVSQRAFDSHSVRQLRCSTGTNGQKYEEVNFSMLNYVMG